MVSFSRIRQQLELVDGGVELVCTAEIADDFVHVAVMRNGREFQHAAQRELELAVAGVFFQQVAENVLSLRLVIIEEGRLLSSHPVGALAVGEQGGVEGEMVK